LRAF